MHTTYITMKDGRKLSGPIRKFKPLEGYMELITSEEKLYFHEIAEANTPDQRGGPCDELAKAWKQIPELIRQREIEIHRTITDPRPSTGTQ